MLFFIVLAAAACSDPGKNLVVITVDTLRADRLSCYGHEGIRTGNIDRLAAEGMIFKKAVSAAPWTCPSVASIFTSLYPEAHGMVLHPIRDAREFKALSPVLTTLAEVLKSEGYETHALSEQIWCSETFGFAQGFDTFEMLEDKQRAITDKAIERIGSLSGDRPFFLYVHYLDPHTPYTPPAEFTLPHPGKGRYGYEDLDWDQWWSKLWSLKPGAPGVEEELSYVKSLYDGEILFVDHEIGRLLESLNRAGLAGDTAVALVSDHGEAFLEHAMLHGSTLFNEELHVPMIINAPWKPELKGAVLDRPASTLDLMPTLLHILGASIPKEVQGTVALPGVKGRPYLFSENAYDVNLKKVRSERFSLILHKASNRYLFFDLQNDPWEQDDVPDLHPEAFKEHMKIMDQWNDAQSRWVKPSSPTIDLSEEMEARLKALGYLK